VSSTRTGETKGKVVYMAPEQLRVDAIDARADVWALCVVLWEACLDRNPFEGARPALTITNILGMPLPDPTESSTDLPPHLCRILRQGLVRDPARRIASAASLADRLEEYLYSLGTPFGMREVAEHVAHAFTAPGAGETTDVEVHAMDAEKTAGTSAVRRLSHGTGRITAPVTAPAVAPVTGSSRRRVRAGAAWLGAIGTTLAAAAAIVWTLATPDPVFDVREKRAGDLGKPATRADPTPEPAAVAPVPPLVVDAAAEAEPVAVQPIAAPPSDSEPAPGGERAAPGFLSVYAVPNAEVWLAGQHLGETPLRRPVQAGRHVVTLKYPDGTAERHRVRVQPGRTARISSAHDP
jgi:serine/threonine-protein kinase